MFEDAFRPYWIDDINAVTGTPTSSLIEIISDKKNYQIYNNVQINNFILNLTDYDSFLKGFAFDINRFGLASLESIIDIHYKIPFKKSHAWKCIKCYYAAYYSAHAFLRVFGITCTNFEQTTINSIENIADLYSNRLGINIEKGYYKCTLNKASHELICNKIVTAGNKGSHEQLWKVFLQKIDDLVNNIKTHPTTVETQTVITKLIDLRNVLTYLGSNGGNWLSKVRNEISYKQTRGLWYPYKSAETYFNKFEHNLDNWEKLPEEIDLSINLDKPLLRYLDTCIFIVVLYLSLAKEISNRCPKGVSFQRNGVLSLLNKMYS